MASKNAPAGYNPPDASTLQVSLSGTTNNQYWYGNSIESNNRFSSSLGTTVSVDRVSLTGSGTAYRSSLWVLGDDGHYLHFSQNVGEIGWSWNARDDGGVGTLAPTGSGNDITELNSLDADFGLHSMKIQLIPTGVLGEVNMFLFLDGNLVAGHGFTAFPADFAIVLTGQARAPGDTVNAIFDNVLVQQVPEPTTAALLLFGGLGFGFHRRRVNARGIGVRRQSAAVWAQRRVIPKPDALDSVSGCAQISALFRSADRKLQLSRYHPIERHLYPHGRLAARQAICGHC